MRPANKALRQLTLDLISIPVMSAEVERVFSQAKRLITTDRNRMNDETIEVLQLLKN
jgi:hAT family C-terminal dimerisation region